MLNRLNHVAMAVPDLAAAAAFYQGILGAEVSEPVDLVDHGVTSIVVQLPNVKLELLAPLGENSPIAGYLAKNPVGGLHHLCFEVKDIKSSIAVLETLGVRVLNQPKPGACGRLVVFMHPKDTFGCLLELEEAH